MFVAHQPHLHDRDPRVKKSSSVRQRPKTANASTSSHFASSSSASYLSSDRSEADSHEGRRSEELMRRVPSANSVQSHTSSSSVLKLIPWRRRQPSKGEAQRVRLPSLVLGSSPSTNDRSDTLTTACVPAPSSSSPAVSIHAQHLQKPNPVPSSPVSAAAAVVKKRTSVIKRKSARPSTAGGKMQTSTESSNESRSSLVRLAASRSEQDLLELGEDLQEVLSTAEKHEALSVQRRSRLLDGSPLYVPYDDSLESSEDLSSYPLPVRLGLATPQDLLGRQAATQLTSTPPSSPEQTRRTGLLDPIRRYSSQKHKHKAQFVDGYYLCTPPPRVHRSQLLTSSVPSSPVLAQGLATFSTASPSSSALKGQHVDRLRPAISSASSRSSSPGGGAWKLHEYFDIQTFKKPCSFGSKERKVHAYPIEDAPYPWGYGNDSLMADVLIHVAVERSIGTSIMKWKDGPPKRVLDIGCGVGHWITDMALRWPETEFVGLDLVPIQKGLSSFGSVGKDGGDVGSAADLQRRITWVVANALDGLPFPAKSFDFVHIRFLNEGVPERKWPKLLTEVTRVLAPGGQLELIELDFSFFGSPMRMRTSDLMDLILGRLNGDMSEGVTCWPVKPKTREDVEASRRNAGLLSVLRQTLNRRGINLNPTSILPFYINSLDNIQGTSHTDLRQIPILARSHRRTFAQARPSSAGGRVSISSLASESTATDASGSSAANVATESSIDALLGLNFVEGANAFSSHAHMKNNVPDVHIRVQDLDALRMAIMQADTLRITDNRHVIWQEIEVMRKSLSADREAVQPSGLPGSDDAGGASRKPSASSLRHKSQEATLAACLRRWPDNAAFERDLDLWQADMQDRTDVDTLLRHKMRGGEAAMRMDGWQHSESLRKKAQRDPAKTFLQIDGYEPSSPPRSSVASGVPSSARQPDDSEVHRSPTTVAGLKETTEILGFRTASFYVVQKSDVKPIDAMPDKRLSQTSFVAPVTTAAAAVA